MKNILQLSAKEARAFFLDSHNYCSLDLPDYFSFDGVLEDAKNYLGNRLFHDVLRNCKNKPSEIEDVNYVLINNKKQRYKWRRMELIHPVFYVGIVNDITQDDNWDLLCKRLFEFRKLERISCCSMPLVNNNSRNAVLNWWTEYEQRSISYSLDYSFMGVTDIENCYPSIYTHSICWAIHTKKVAKAVKGKNSYLGNRIDEYIRDMHSGQTNGIPQGSVLMDFIAELVLGYADELLSDKLDEIGIVDYRILRYRDDYRIFANEKSIVEEILKQLTIVLQSLNFNLNAEKTFISSNVIIDSLKEDKLSYIQNSVDASLNIQKRLLFFYEFSLRYPNSGTIKRYLSELYKTDFCDLSKRPNSYQQIISIVVEIMYRNPDACVMCVGILSVIFDFLKMNVVHDYIKRLLKKFDKNPFSDYIDIWIQRITLISSQNYTYNCRLCQKVYSPIDLWDSSWMDRPLDESTVVDFNVINSITPRLTKAEVDKFNSRYDN